MYASFENVKESGLSVERRVGRRVGRRLSCRRLKDDMSEATAADNNHQGGNHNA